MPPGHFYTIVKVANQYCVVDDMTRHVTYYNSFSSAVRRRPSGRKEKTMLLDGTDDGIHILLYAKSHHPTNTHQPQPEVSHSLPKNSFTRSDTSMLQTPQTIGKGASGPSTTLSAKPAVTPFPASGKCRKSKEGLSHSQTNTHKSRPGRSHSLPKNSFTRRTLPIQVRRRLHLVWASGPMGLHQHCLKGT